MTYSMTGYARQAFESAWGTLDIEIRGVNHRYLDITPRLPASMRSLESEARAAIGQTVARGKIDLNVHLDRTAGARQIVFDTARLAAVADAISRIQSKGIDCRAPDALALLDYPGVVRAPASDVAEIRETFLNALAQILEQFQTVRGDEGARLAKTVHDRLQTLAGLTARVAERLPAVVESWRTRLERRLADMQVDVDNNRLEQEMAQLAQRADIAEEVDRLEGHVEALTGALESEQPSGRRLDFLMQECNRETNTIGSKSQDSEISASVIDMKVVIEQMREQIQNIE